MGPKQGTPPQPPPFMGSFRNDGACLHGRLGYLAGLTTRKKTFKDLSQDSKDK